MHAEWNPKNGAVYRCARGTRELGACPFPSILGHLVDPHVDARVKAVLRDPGIIAREVERRRCEGGLDRDLERIETRLAAIGRKQANTARAIAALNDDAAAAPLLVELKSLAEQKAGAESEFEHMRRRIADRAGEDARVLSLAEWCARVSTNVEKMTYEDKRLALAWLGVQEKRAVDSGDSETAARSRRRRELVSG